MISLLLALAAPLFAPPLAVVARRSGAGALQALDAFVLVAAGGLALLVLVPETMAEAGPAALIAAALGLLLPALAEGLLRGHGLPHRLLLLLAVAGLALHAAVDGAALAAAGSEALRSAATMGVVLHRLPFSLLLWLALTALFGRAAAAAGILLLEGATLTGWLAAGFASGLAGRPAALLLAVVAGGLLHVLVHQGVRGGGGRLAGAAGAAGGLLGAAAILPVLAGGDVPGFLAAAADAWRRLLLPGLWLPLLAGGGLALLLAVPARRRWLPARAPFPLPLLAGWSAPICSCGAGPLYEDALLHGARPGTATLFLHGATLLRPEVLAVVIVLLGPAGALVWLAGALALALAEAWQARRVALLSPPLLGRHPEGVPDPGGGRGRRLSREAMDWLDHQAAWLVAGAVLLALTHRLMPLLTGLEPLLREHPRLSTVAVACMALPLRLHAPVAAVLAWRLAELGAPSGAVLACLLLGPVGGRGVQATLRRLHGRPAARLRAAGRLGVGLGAALALDLSGNGAPELHFPVPGGAALPAGPAVLLVLPVVLSWLRSGPRGWLAQVLPGDEHAHAHHPGHPHEHAGPQRMFLEALPGGAAGASMTEES